MTQPSVLFCSSLVLSLLLAGCSEREGSQPVDTFATQVEARAGVPFTRKGAAVSLVVPASVVSGERVLISLRIANATSTPLDLYLRGPEATLDIEIMGAEGDRVWRRLEGAAIPAGLQRKTLRPGEVMELTHVWNQNSQRGGQVTPGRYTVRGSVLTDGQSTLESTATIQITPP